MVDIEDNKKENNNTSKQVLLSVLGVAILIVAVVGISFAAFTYTQAGERENTISTGTVTMAYNEPDNGITIENAIPMPEGQGKVLTGENNLFDFTVTATIKGKTAIDYEVVAVKQTVENPIPDEDIRLYLEAKTDQNDYTEVSGPKPFTADEPEKYEAEGETMQLDSGTFSNKDGSDETKNFSKSYRLRMWVDSAYNLTGTSQTYKVTVNVYGKGQD